MFTPLFFYFFYRLNQMNDGVMLNIIVVYGFIFLFGVILFFIKKLKGEEAKSSNIVALEDEFLNLGLVAIVFLAVSIIIWCLFGKLLIVDNNFTREFGFFLNVLDNLKINIYPNINFYYPYGVLPVAIYYFFDLIIKNPITALVSTKIFLDLIAVLMIVYLFKLLRSKRNIYFLLLIAISGFQILFFSPGALHNSPIRYLILLLPLILLLKFLEKKNIFYFLFFLFSPIISYLVGPETGLVAIVFTAIMLLVIFIDKDIYAILKERKIYLAVSIIPFLFLIWIFHKDLFLLLRNSYQYAGSITSGLASYGLPAVFPIIFFMIKTKSLNGIVQLSWNIMFYAYFFLLSVLVSYSLSCIFRFFKERKVLSNDLIIVSLTFFALAYLLKSLGGFVGISYESLTIFFVIMAFIKISKEYSGWDLKISKYILILYIAVLLLPWGYFLYKLQIAKRGDYLPFYDKRTNINLIFSNNYLVSIKSLVNLTQNIDKNKKIFLFTDDAPGMYYLVGRPNYTRYLNPGFVFSENTRNELLDDLKINNFDYIFIAKREVDYFSYERSKKTLEFIDDYLKNNYVENNNDQYYKILTKK